MNPNQYGVFWRLQISILNEPSLLLDTNKQHLCRIQETSSIDISNHSTHSDEHLVIQELTINRGRKKVVSSFLI